MTSHTVLYAQADAVVRESPEADAHVTFTLLKGESVEVDRVIRAETDGTDWVRIHYSDGRMGWCERHQLSEITPGTA